MLGAPEVKEGQLACIVVMSGDVAVLFGQDMPLSLSRHHEGKLTHVMTTP